MFTKKLQDSTENENWEKKSKLFFGYQEMLRKLKENDKISIEKKNYFFISKKKKKKLLIIRFLYGFFFFFF